MVLDNGEPWAVEPFELELADDLFGGTPEVWLVVGEGNGKTTLLSGIALYHGDYTLDAMVTMAAASRDQCGLLFDQAAGFVNRSPGFRDRFRVFEGYRRINCLRTDGRIQVFAADERTGDGVIPTLAMCDELHRHRDLRLYRTWRGKLGKRGGQLTAISTAGEPGSEFEVIRERMRTTADEVRVNGRHVRAATPEMVLHDYALRAEDDPEDLALVKQANPFGGITLEDLRRKRAAPTMTLPHWLRFVCNRPAREVANAVGEQEWLEARIEEPDVTGLPCDLGIDLGWKYDATAIVPLFSWEEGWLLGRPVVLVPPRDGNSLRPEVVERALLELRERHLIGRVVLDPAAGGEQLAGWIEDELGAEVVAHSQTNQPMALAASRFLEGLRTGRLHHMGDRTLSRHVMNGVAKQLHDGQLRFARPTENRGAPGQATTREIDALIAAAMVHSVAVAAAEGQRINIDDYRITRV